MKKPELLVLLKAYSQRYGAYTMQEETMDMWWNKLRSEDFEQTKEVIYGLIGEKERPFGWGVVINHLDMKFPPEDAQAALEREWKSKPENNKETDKRKEIGAFMRSLISEIKEARRISKPFDWVTPYARNFIDIFGKKEAERISRHLSLETGATEHEERFLEAVRKGVRCN